MISPKVFIRHLSSQLLALILSMFVYLIYQSVWPHSDPITVDISNVRVQQDAYGTKVTWDCSTKVHRHVQGRMHRQLDKRDGSETISLPSSVFKLSTNGMQTPIKSVAIPGSLSPGEWCMTTRLYWYETLSLRESNMKGMEACFTITENKQAGVTDRLTAIEKMLKGDLSTVKKGL